MKRYIVKYEYNKPKAEVSQKDILNAAWNWYIMQWEREAEYLKRARNAGIDTEISEFRERQAWERVKAVEDMTKAVEDMTKAAD